MSQEKYQMIKEIKALVRKMLAERNALMGDKATLMPSEYWAEYCKYFKYLLDLPEEYFLTLRNHTFHLTGDIYSEYMPPKEVREKNCIKAFDALWAQVPPEYRISEPQQGYGFYYNGRWINRDVRRYQEIINALHKEGILKKLKTSSDPVNILEIGAGFGGLTYNLAQCLRGKDNCKYFVIDIPEVLLFSASYLSLYANPGSVYLYNSENAEKIKETGFKGYDFIFIPSFQTDLLSGYNFDLVLNVASFQEMRAAQINQYLDFIQQHLKGFLFSRNRDINVDQNTEGLNLREALKKRFVTKEVETISNTHPLDKDRIYNAFRSIAKRMFSRPSEDLIPNSTLYKSYICTSKR